jgi:hypothetical protein
MVFERKVLRKVFGPTNKNGIWRIKTNQLDKIIKHKNVINFITAQRLGWLGHIEGMQETRMVKAILSWKPISKRPIGRPKTLSSSLCNFLHSPVTSSLLGPNTLLNTLFSNNLILRSSLSVSDQVSHPYRTTSNIIVLYILIFNFLDSKLEDKRFCTE